MNDEQIKSIIVGVKQKGSVGAQLHEQELAILQLALEVEILKAKLEAKEQTKIIRNVIQIATKGDYLLTLCDDGTIWIRSIVVDAHHIWLKYPPIPQD